MCFMSVCVYLSHIPNNKLVSQPSAKALYYGEKDVCFERQDQRFHEEVAKATRSKGGDEAKVVEVAGEMTIHAENAHSMIMLCLAYDWRSP